MTTATDRLRIDDLAQRSGIPSGTIRFYQRQGLIEPPEREGRVAYYSEDHLRRLERVRALQAQGLPLSVVGDLLARGDAGEDIGAWLALDSAVFGRLDPTESVEELMARLVESGMPEETIRAGAETVTKHLRAVADEMAALGWDVFAAERVAIAADEPVAEEVLERLERLRSLAQRAVMTLFRGELDRAIQARAEPFAREAARRSRKGSA